MLHVYGVTEDEVRREWTLGKFRVYRDFAIELLKAKRSPI